MEIKRSSWHYEINSLDNNLERDIDNLCCYFWKLIGRLALFLFVAFIVCFLIYGCYVLIYDWFTSIHFISITIMFLFICSSVALPILAIRFLRKRLGKSPEMPYGNIVTEYMAAKKQKVCPLITYIE